MVVETALSMVTTVCHLKKIHHRFEAYLHARRFESLAERLAFVCAMFNVLLGLFRKLHPETDPFRMSIAEFSL
jgi:hypothetical protein